MELRRILKSRYFLLASTAIWSLLFLIHWLKSSFHVGFEMQEIIYTSGAYFMVLWLLSFLIQSYYLTINKYPLKTQVYYHSIGAFITGVLHFILTGLFILVFERLLLLEEHYTFQSLIQHYSENWIQITEGIGWYLIYTVVIMLINYYYLFKKEQKRVIVTESSLADSNFQVLSTQLSPHFLFNAMNSIAMMVRKEENKQAVGMIASLSEMLRAAMSQKNRQFVTLESEIALLNKYLDIELARFKGRVDVSTSFSEVTLKARVPQLVIQPLVENAFKHGVANSLEKAEIKVSADKIKDQLVLSVFNSGEGQMQWDLTNSKSLGLPNTIHRLRQVYDSTFKFQVIEKETGILFQITIPFKEIDSNR